MNDNTPTAVKEDSQAEILKPKLGTSSKRHGGSSRATKDSHGDSLLANTLKHESTPTTAHQKQGSKKVASSVNNEKLKQYLIQQEEITPIHVGAKAPSRNGNESANLTSSHRNLHTVGHLVVK